MGRRKRRASWMARAAVHDLRGVEVLLKKMKHFPSTNRTALFMEINDRTHNILRDGDELAAYTWLAKRGCIIVMEGAE